MPSKHWEAADKFHEELHPQHKLGNEGFQAFRYLESKLEPYWDDEGTTSHPLRLLMFGAAESIYRQLIDVAAHVHAIEHDPCFKSLMKRLGLDSEAVAVLQEIDSFYRLRMGGLSPKFVPIGSTPTPEMTVEHGGEKLWVEVTAIDNSLQANPLMEISQLAGLIQLTFDSTIGGYIVGPFGKNEYPVIESQLYEAAINASTFGTLETVLVPGRIAAYAVPKKLADTVVPKECQGFRYYETGRLSHAESIIRKIREKVAKAYKVADRGFIVLFDRYMAEEDLKEILDTDIDPIMRYLSNCPSVTGVALVMPQGFTHDMLLYGDQSKTRRFYRTYAARGGAAEKVLVWVNGKNAEVQKAIAMSFVNFGKNLRKTAP